MSGAVKVIHDIIKDMEGEKEAIRKNMSYAVKRVAFDAMQSLRLGLQNNQLDLAGLSPYRNDPGDKRCRRSKAVKSPLGRMRAGIGYSAPAYRKSTGVSARAADFRAEVGFLDDDHTLPFCRATRAEKHLAGYAIPVDDATRAALNRKGIHLRAATSRIQVPARDPVGNWYDANKDNIVRTIRDNFERKQRGERI